jgi:hypothetical protein
MKLHVCTRGLLAGAISLMALAGGAGVAQADPDTTASTVDEIDEPPVPEPAILFANPNNQQVPPVNWDGVGMYCQNLHVTCR